MFNLLLRDGKRPRWRTRLARLCVGDVHGRLDLLDSCWTRSTPTRHRPASKVLLVFRRRPDRPRAELGPGDRAAPNLPATGVRTVFLLGNHEEVLLRILGGEAELIAKMAVVRRDRMSRSYGVDTSQFAKLRR